MVNFKEEIAKLIAAEVTDLEISEIQSMIEVPQDSKMGDYAFPCFKLAKSLKKAPPTIATEIKSNIKIDGIIIEKIEIVGGYRYHMYVNADGQNAGKIYIGCEAYLADNFQKIPCKNPLYQRYFSACKANGRLDNNLSNMFGCVSEYMAACQTPEEVHCLNQLVNRLFSVVYA